MSAANLVAQCTGSAPCELPTGLPWYFGLAVLVVWLAVVAGAVLLGRRLLVSRLQRRRRRGTERLALDERTSGTDIEPW